jgi:aquaporin Z
MFSNIGHLGASAPGAGITAWTAMIFEAVLTAGLVSVILGTASGARNVGTNAAIAVAGYIILAGLWAAPISGASMNPARSLGPAIVGGYWRDWWVYLLGPIAGAVIAVGIAQILRAPKLPKAQRIGRLSTPAEHAARAGRLSTPAGVAG